MKFVLTDWESWEEHCEPGLNFYYTDPWGMHIYSLYLMPNNRHMLHLTPCICYLATE
jgi:hypothetical protein